MGQRTLNFINPLVRWASGRKRNVRQSLILPFLFLCFTLLPSGSAQNVTQWRVPEGNAAPSNTTAINAIAFSLDGTQLAIATTNGITLYDTYTGKELSLFSAPLDNTVALAFSPDNRTVASASGDATLHLWDTRTSEHRTHSIGHTYPVVALAFSPDGNTLATGSFREIRLWNLTTRQPTQTSVLEGHRDMVTTLAFSPDSKILASTSFYGTILLWDIETGQRRHNLPAHTDSITSLTFSPDNRTLASGGYWSLDTESTIHLWDIHTGHLLTTVEGHTDPVFALAFSPGAPSLNAEAESGNIHGNILASAGWDSTIQLWHPQIGPLYGTFEGDTPPVLALAFLPDSQSTYRNTLASVDLDGTIQLWSLTTPPKSSDVNADGVVNVLDLTFIASRFGQSSPDLNGDGIVNILDLTLGAQHFGK